MPNVQNKIKAADRREAVDAQGVIGIAGKRFHFIGAGGIGMSGLAQFLIRHHGVVSGSDQTASDLTEKLENLAYMQKGMDEVKDLVHIVSESITNLVKHLKSEKFKTEIK